MQHHSARRRVRAAAVIVAGALVALVLVGHSAFGVKTYQTEVIGKVGTFTAYDQTFGAPEKSDAVHNAEADAAAAIQSFGACASHPRVVSKKKFNIVVQLTDSPCPSGAVLDCNSSGGQGTTESSAPPSPCGTTTTTEEGGDF